MKKTSPMIQIIIYAICMMILILDGKTALSGAREGVELCIKTVIPSLFPFFIITSLLINSLYKISFPGEIILSKLLSMPKNSGKYLISAFLGGYPIGAQCIAEGYRSGDLSKNDAHRMLGFCNNAGPAFIFGICTVACTTWWFPWALWGIHITSALMVGMILPKNNTSSISEPSVPSVSLPEALEKAIKTMGLVCGWVILFRILLQFMDRWFLWYVPIHLSCILKGFLEISNGCLEVIKLEYQKDIFLSLSLILGLGGACVSMQTISVTKELGSGCYFPGKILQAAISFLLAWIISPKLFPHDNSSVYSVSTVYIVLGTAAATLLLLYRKKTVAFYRKMVYNDEKQAREIDYAVS